MRTGQIKSYQNGYFYIIDDVKPNQSNTGEHGRKCDGIRKFFEDFTDYKIRSVRIPDQRKAEKAFFRYWKDELASKTSDDLLIIHFEGDGAHPKKEYSWSFVDSYPRRGINAYDFIEMVAQSEADSLFLLECAFYDRVSDKWSRDTGNTEIIQSGQTLQNGNGKKIDDPNAFTYALVRNLKQYINDLTNGRRKQAKALTTIPKILASDKDMHSNPRRYWLNRTRAGADDVVLRFRIDPDEVRESGKLEIFAEQIQGPSEEVEDGVQEMQTATNNNAEYNVINDKDDTGNGTDHGDCFTDEALGDDMNAHSSAHEPSCLFVQPTESGN